MPHSIRLLDAPVSTFNLACQAYEDVLAAHGSMNTHYNPSAPVHHLVPAIHGALKMILGERWPSEQERGEFKVLFEAWDKERRMAHYYNHTNERTAGTISCGGTVADWVKAVNQNRSVSSGPLCSTGS